MILSIIEAVQASRVEDDRSERKVTEYPGQHDSASEALVVICLLFLFRDDIDFFGWFRGEYCEFCVILCVQVAVVLRDVDVDLSAWFEIRRGQFLGLVVALCAPCDVVGVAEGVDV